MDPVTEPTAAQPSSSEPEPETGFVNLVFIVLLGGGLAMGAYRLDWHHEALALLLFALLTIPTSAVNRRISSMRIRRLVALPELAALIWVCARLDWGRVWWCVLAIVLAFIVAIPAGLRRGKRRREAQQSESRSDGGAA